MEQLNVLEYCKKIGLDIQKDIFLQDEEKRYERITKKV